MGKGSYPGGGTVIGPKDVSWFGSGGPTGGLREDADQITRRQAMPLTAQSERRISDLRIDIKGLQSQLDQLERDRTAKADALAHSRADLAQLLRLHGLPLDSELTGTAADCPSTGTTKTTRHQRRKRAKANYSDGR